MQGMTRRKNETITTFNGTFGSHINTYRVSNGFTQQELGNKIGVSKRAICAYEHNNSMPPIHVLVKMAAVFHVTIDELLGRNASTAEPHKLRKRWLRKFNAIDKLPEKEQRTIIQVIDMALKSNPSNNI